MAAAEPTRSGRAGKVTQEANRNAGRPIDLVHLGRQTMGDRALEEEILKLFARQALSMRDDLMTATGTARLRLAHTLKGSALSVGAFVLAETVRRLELEPDNPAALDAVSAKVEEVSNFVAAISR